MDTPYILFYEERKQVFVQGDEIPEEEEKEPMLEPTPTKFKKLIDQDSDNMLKEKE